VSAVVRRGRDAFAEMPRMQAQQKKRMEQLRGEKGAAFDQAFLTAMTEHHREGMPDMKACVAQDEHADLKSLCRKMTEEQQKETVQMGEWRRGWGTVSGKKQD